MREQVRRLGCMPSHIPRIFTSRQPGAQRMSPPQRDPAGLWRFRAIGRSRPFRRGRRFQRRLPGRCVASARHVLPAAATTTEAGIGMRVDPDWLAYPPTRPASHIPALNHAQRSCIPPPARHRARSQSRNLRIQTAGSCCGPIQRAGKGRPNIIVMIVVVEGRLGVGQAQRFSPQLY